MKKRSLGYTSLIAAQVIYDVYKRTFMEKDFLNIQEYHEFVKSMKVYPEKHAILYPALGLCGEAGEFAEKVKKYLRGDGDGILDKDACIKELGDVLWYICSAADDLGYTLQDVVDRNVEKLKKRTATGTRKGSGDNREDQAWTTSQVPAESYRIRSGLEHILAKGETEEEIIRIRVDEENK